MYLDDLPLVQTVVALSLLYLFVSCLFMVFFGNLYFSLLIVITLIQSLYLILSDMDNTKALIYFSIWGTPTLFVLLLIGINSVSQNRDIERFSSLFRWSVFILGMGYVFFIWLLRVG